MTITDLVNHNPDVLTCVANLSNDEVFTPPDIANQMLDRVADAWAKDHDGENLWQNPKVTFLDPFTKSGVFLREITRRLVSGLVMRIPDLQQRVDHILTRQVFGIGITNLTALLARRSVYCSKWANGKHSICKAFENDWGNIWFERTEHTWVGGSKEVRLDPLTGGDQTIYTHRHCVYCGAGEDDYARGNDMESHAYALIHTDDIKSRMNEMFGEQMHFDVVIGNPPYQLSDGGYGVSAKPIYHLFIDQAKKLDPRYLSMIIPARWYSGGKGLDDFRQEMLTDSRIVALHDFPDSRDVFPDVDVAGGICYFLWAQNHNGITSVTTHVHGDEDVSERALLEPGNDIFIRNSRAISILRKIYSVEMKTSLEESKTILPENLQMATPVSSRKPFGFPTNFRGRSEITSTDSVKLVRNNGIDWISRNEIRTRLDAVDRWKVFTSNASHDHAGQPDKTGTRRVLGRTSILEPNAVVTETYILLGIFESQREAESCLSYVITKFVRFLVALRSSTQHITKSRFKYVPLQSWDHSFSDKELYSRYGLDESEINLIEQSIRPMNGK